MTDTVDEDTILNSDLSELSRKALQPNVLEYHIRSLFDRDGYRTAEIKVRTVRLDPKSKKNLDYGLVILGPYYDDMEDEEDYSPFVRQWRNFYANYLSISPFRKRFINGLVQLRFVSFNPLTIYYQLLQEEQKKIDRVFGRSEIKMKRLVEKPSKIKVPEKPVVKKLAEEEMYRESQSQYDGHFPIERSEEETQRPGMSNWAEGYVDDAIPADIRKIDPELDFPNGAIVNMFPEFPFYAFNYWNVFKKIEELNRMIEAGLMVVFVEEHPEVEMKKVIQIYREFFIRWGIPIIDYVSMERIVNSQLPYLIPNDGILPGMFIVKRPLERLHSSAWMGMNGGRRRGLAGIPWAGSLFNGSRIVSPQPDDGFLNTFIKSGLKRAIEGTYDAEIRFPLCTLLTSSEIKERIITPMESLLKRDIRFRFEDKLVGRVDLRSRGEWVLLRGLMRKFL